MQVVLKASHACRSFQAPPVVELHRLLSRLRWRLGLERGAQSAIRGVIGSGITLVILALAIWLTAADSSWLYLAAAPLLAALGFAVLRWPTLHQTALVADQRLGLEERLATALELSQSGHGGRFDLVQVRDAVTRSSPRTGGWLVLNTRTRNEVSIAVAALVLAAVLIVLLPGIPRPAVLTPAPPTDLVDGTPTADTAADQSVPPEAAADQAAAPDTGTNPAPPPPDLANRVQQEQAESAALDSLAQGLGSVSAGQGAADAIQRGDFGAARDQIQSLGEEADQLSDAAKQQLARGLQQAAAASSQSDRALADREQQAAQALSRATYADQRQALSALADQVQRSGARSVPADQLQRDQGQLQQQQQQLAQQQAQQSGAGQTQSGGAAPNLQSSAGQPGASASNPAAGADQGAQTNSALGGASDSNNGGAQQGGAGVGTGTSPDPFSNQASRLDASGQEVQVPTRLSGGTSTRPADGTEEQTANDPSLGGQSVAQQAQAQQTGQVNPEANRVPGDQRPVVRGYFR